jgi:hypothetical protein
MKKLLALLSFILASVPTAAQAGWIQQQDFKTAAQCIAQGASVATCLELDTMIYVTANGINETLYQAIVNGDMGGVTWGSITGTLSSQTDLSNALALKAPLASPTFTGSVIAPTFVGALTGHASLDLESSNNLSDVASQQTALNNLAGGVTSGKYLRGNGSNVVLSSILNVDIPAPTLSSLGGIEASTCGTNTWANQVNTWISEFIGAS